MKQAEIQSPEDWTDWANISPESAWELVADLRRDGVDTREMAATLASFLIARRKLLTHQKESAARFARLVELVGLDEANAALAQAKAAAR